MLVERRQLETLGAGLKAAGKQVDELVGESGGQAGELARLEARIGALHARAGVERADKSALGRVEVKESLELGAADRAQIHDSVSGLDFGASFISGEGEWRDYIREVEEYARANDIDLKKDPFDVLLSPHQKAHLMRRIDEDFEQPGRCDKWDYVIAATCGALAGVVDAVFVGAPGSVLGNMTDRGANALVERFAKLCGWSGPHKGSDPTRSAIGFLERRFPVNYDHPHGVDVGGVFDMSPSNHHLKSLAHSPSPIGLFFSVLDQFTGEASFVADGRLIRITSESKLQGGDLVSKLFAAFCNWLGHIMSDVAGASGATGKGSGVSIPFYELLQFLDVGQFGKEKRSIAELAVKVFEQGYDARFGAALSVPVLLDELFIRLLWVLKRRYYHKDEWRDCWPSAKHAGLRRMLLVGHGCLALVDLTDAFIRGGGQPVLILSRMNFVAWTRFAFLGLREAYRFGEEGAKRFDLIEERLDVEMKELLGASSRG